MPRSRAQQLAVSAVLALVVTACAAAELADGRGTTVRVPPSPSLPAEGRPTALQTAQATTPGSEGARLSSISVSARAADGTSAALSDLQTYLSRMSGAQVAMGPLGDPPRAEGVVVVLASELPAGGLRDAVQPLGHEGYALRTSEKAVWIVAGTPLGLQHGIYRLLDLLGVRWFFPGEAWEVVPAQVRMPTTDLRERPAFRRRSLFVNYGFPSPRSRAEFSDWARRNRLGGELTGNFGHAYQRIVDPRKYFASHPEYFALVGGRRVPDGQIETCDPEVVRLGVQYAIDSFTQHPDQSIVSVSPNDGGGFSESDRCRAEGSVSDRTLLFANRVADGIGARFPDKLVGFYAYHLAAPPPSLTGRDNVAVSIATQFIPKPFTFDQLMAGWSRKVKRVFVRDYYSFYPWDRDLPVSNAAVLAERIRSLQGRGVEGVDAEMGNNWAAQGLNYYLAARLLWNGQSDVAAYRQEFLRKVWGPAAPAMAKYYDQWRADGVVSRAALRAAYEALQRARIAAGADADVLGRISLFEMYLHYVKRSIDYDQQPVATPRTEAIVRDFAATAAWLGERNMVHVTPLARGEWKRRFRALAGSITDEQMAGWLVPARLSDQDIRRIADADIRELATDR